VEEYTDMGLERLDGEEAEFDRIREALQSLPFLASKKLVVLKNPSANKQFVEQVEPLLSDLSEITDVLIVETKLDKRLSYYKYLKSKTDFKEFNELDEQGMARWLVDESKAQKAELNQADARYLVERVGLNQQLLSNELSKLISYNPKITKQTIEILTDKTPQSTIFELIDAAMAGRTKQAVTLYAEQRALKVEPQQILAMIIWQLHVLAVVKTGGERSAEEIAKAAKLSPFVVRKTQNIARKLSLAELKTLINEVLELDVALKSQSIDADDALQNLILKLGQ
jgi:DNA polymerase III subunit delta